MPLVPSHINQKLKCMKGGLFISMYVWHFEHPYACNNATLSTPSYNFTLHNCVFSFCWGEVGQRRVEQNYSFFNFNVHVALRELICL